MKYLRNLRTGRLMAYDEKLVDPSRYELVDDEAKQESAPAAEEAPAPQPVSEIQSAAQNLLKRKPRKGGFQDQVGATEKISIQLTRG
jgi:hypothetical protein